MEEDVKWNVHFNKTGKSNRRICTSTFRLTEKWLCWAHLLRLLAVLLIKSFYIINTATDRHMKFTYLIQIPAYKHLYADSPALIICTKQENWKANAIISFTLLFSSVKLNPSFHLDLKSHRSIYSFSYLFIVDGGRIFSEYSFPETSFFHCWHLDPRANVWDKF